MSKLVQASTGILEGCWPKQNTFEQDLARCRRRGYGTWGWLNVPNMLERYFNTGGSESPLGECMDYSGLTSALARTVGIPSRMATGIGSGGWNFHAWDEVWLNGINSNEWSAADATPGEIVGAYDRCYSLFQNRNILSSSAIYTFSARTGSSPANVLNQYLDCTLQTNFALAKSDVSIEVTTAASEYGIGDLIPLEVTIQNTGTGSLSGSLNISVSPALAGIHRVESFSLPARSVNVPPQSFITETFTLTPQEYRLNGEFIVTAAINGLTANHTFAIKSGFNVSLLLPDTVDSNRLLIRANTSTDPGQLARIQQGKEQLAWS